MQAKPVIIDLFSGCGGFSLGAHKAGVHPTLAFDNDPVLSSSYAYNFPRAKLTLQSVRTLQGPDIMRAVEGRVDGIIGGPPCQAFSEIGRRRKADPRRNLLRHFFRLVAELRPGFFVMENVRGLGRGDARAYLDESLNVLPGTYRLFGPVVFDAKDFGAATLRPRIFIIGYDPKWCDAFSAEDFELEKRSPATVRDAIADLKAPISLGDIDGFDAWKISGRNRGSAYASLLRSADKTFTGHRFTTHTDAVLRRFHSIKPGEIDVVGRHPRLTWGGQCPNLRAGTGSDKGSYQAVRPIHPTEDRVITVREAARLQGFHDSFRFHPTVWHSFRMIGNSVSPLMSQAILSVVMRKMGFNGMRVAAE